MHIDGRQNNGSKRNATLWNDEIKPLNCLNIYSSNKEYCIDTIQISEKSNEIPAVQECLDRINLKNVVVTFDALNTQKETIEKIIHSKGDYVVPIKGNQNGFYHDLQLYFDEKCCDEIMAGRLNSVYSSNIEKSHSSIIKYEYFQTSDTKWYLKCSSWNKLNSIGMVRKRKSKKAIQESRYYISSLLPNIELFKKAVRGHWIIENNLHWQLDYTFRQDENTTQKKKSIIKLRNNTQV